MERSKGRWFAQPAVQFSPEPELDYLKRRESTGRGVERNSTMRLRSWSPSGLGGRTARSAAKAPETTRRTVLRSALDGRVRGCAGGRRGVLRLVVPGARDTEMSVSEFTCPRVRPVLAATSSTMA